MKLMVFLTTFILVFVFTAARPQEATILRQDQMTNVDGYSFIVETSDGKTHQEEGSLRNTGTENEYIVVRGAFSFVADDGRTYTVNYIADENGFQPQGDHLP